MAFETAPVWDDNPGEVKGNTSYGFYDLDSEFIEDAKKFSRWAARRLGYPIISIELTDKIFYNCFEESVSDFTNQVNQFNIRENRLAAQGLSTSVNLTQKTLLSTGLPQIIRLSKQYGAEAGAGGNITWNKGYIDVQNNIQDYDLKIWAQQNVSGKDIEIRRIFHEGTPAVSRYYDPFVETGLGRNNILDEFGWGGIQPAVQYVLFPIYEDILRVQAVELNDQIRRSAYSFELKNNVLRIFPIPTSDYKIWFEYIFTEDRDKSSILIPSGSTYEQYINENSTTQSDFSNIQYQIIPYSNINQPGKHWIRKYGLACAKETLGLIRSKYQQIPIPNAEVSLDGDTLRSEAQSEKENLINQLRETLEESSISKQWEKKQSQEEAMTTTLKHIPLPFYVG